MACVGAKVDVPAVIFAVSWRFAVFLVDLLFCWVAASHFWERRGVENLFVGGVVILLLAGRVGIQMSIVCS